MSLVAAVLTSQTLLRQKMGFNAIRHGVLCSAHITGGRGAQDGVSRFCQMINIHWKQPDTDECALQAEEAPSTRLAAAALQAAAQAEEAAGAAGDRDQEPALDRLPPAIAALLPRRPYTGECPGSPAVLHTSAFVTFSQH